MTTIQGQADPFGHKGQAAAYASARPTYPQALLDVIGKRLTEKKIAVDIACGSGQLAALLPSGLGFEKVYGIDRSPEQVKAAKNVEGVEYMLGSAMEVPLPSDGADLVAVAQGIHWWWDSVPQYNQEVARLLKPGGCAAVLGYGRPNPCNAALKKAFDEYYFGLLDSHNFGAETCYWEIDRKLVDNGLEGLSLVPPFENSERTWVTDKRTLTLDKFIEYLHSMSGYRQYLKRNGLEVGDEKDPLVAIREKFFAELSPEAKDGSTPLDVDYPFYCILANKPSQ